VGTRPSRLGFGHLHVHTEFSMLDGASPAEVLVAEAARLGQPFLAMTDHDSVAGVVKFHAACRQYGVQPITGAEVTIEDGSHLTLLAETPTGYANLCQLLTLSFAHGGRKTPRLPVSALDGFTSGLLCLTGCHKGRVSTLVRRKRYREAQEALDALIGRFGKANVYVELQDDWTPGSLLVVRELAQLADTAGVGSVASNNVHYASPHDWIAHDVLRCIAVGCVVDEIHPSRPINRERFLKSTAQMCELFDWRPQAIGEAFRIAERCQQVLPSAADITPDLWGDADAVLWQRAHRGAVERYGTNTGVIGERLQHELSVIRQLGYSGYMLMCSDVVAWARSAGIRCTGRGSAADSLVAYTLYLTDIDVLRRDLLFSRFLRDGKKPDVDTDFPSDRRDEVFRHVVDTYGEDYVGAVAATPPSALRRRSGTSARSCSFPQTSCHGCPPTSATSYQQMRSGKLSRRAPSSRPMPGCSRRWRRWRCSAKGLPTCRVTLPPTAPAWSSVDSHCRRSLRSCPRRGASPASGP